MPTSASPPKANYYANSHKGQPSSDNILSNINIYNGCVAMPLALVNLQGDDSLSFSVQANYSSTLGDAPVRRNKEYPTSVMGQGWSYPLSCIVDRNNMVNDGYQGDFYFVAEGGTFPLNRLFEKNGYVYFHSIEHPLWAFSYYYDEQTSYWLVIKEDGTTWKFGGSASSVELRLSWDNWVGAALTEGTESFPVGWYLKEIVTINGANIQLDYENVLAPLGSANYTKAIRLSSIIGTNGDKVVFRYKLKEDFEYVPAFDDGPGGNAYQCGYDDSYLERIDVYNTDEVLLYYQSLEYVFNNISGENGCCKRYLDAVTQVDADGSKMPPMKFTYELDAGAQNPGALLSAKYPMGAVVSHQYGKTDFPQATGSTSVTPPQQDWKTQTVHATDYVVCTFTSDDSIWVRILYWDMGWQTFDDQTFAERDVDHAHVMCGNGFFALVYYSQYHGRNCARLYRRSILRNEVWVKTDLLLDGEPEMQAVACGADYFAAHIASHNAFRVWQYHFEKDEWVEYSLPVSNSDFQALGAGDGFVLGAYYSEAGSSIRLQIFYADEALEWKHGAYQDIQHEIDYRLTSTQSVWSIGQTQASATFVTVHGQEYADAVSVLMRWRKDYTLADVEYQNVRQLYDVKNPIAYSRVSGDIVGFAQHIFRYAPVSWRKYELLNPQSGGEYRYAYGADLAMAVENLDGCQRFYAIRFDPYTMDWSSEGVPHADDLSQEDSLCTPVIGGDYAVLGRNLFCRNSQSKWDMIYRFPEYALMNSVSLDAAGGYLLFQANTEDTVIKLDIVNGVVEDAFHMYGQRCLNEGQTAEGAGQASFHTTSVETGSVQLYALENKIFKESRCIAVVQSVSLDTGFDIQTSVLEYHVESARIENSIPLFKKVISSSDGRIFGRIEHFYFNGLSQDHSQAKYPPSDSYCNVREFTSQFSGRIYHTDEYNSDGELVVANYSYLKAMDDFGFLILPTKTLERKWLRPYDVMTGVVGEPKLVETFIENEYEPTYFQLQSSCEKGLNGDGRELILRKKPPMPGKNIRNCWTSMF